MQFATTIDIDAPPERVFVVMADVERWAEWTASITSIARLDQGPFAIGSRARVRQPRLPVATWQVTALEPGHGFTWVAGNALTRVAGHHWVVAHGTGSRATLAIDYSGPLGPLLGRATRGLNERYLGLEAAGLKRRAEAAPLLTP